ncbi:aromatic acid exporter family protein [Geodermatophilus sp. TF02-6]|uniref:FUSC family protein n=1 Tax=Geodermatophilus sp. TF02-6 TaxID=2250575 RepID=UPI00131494D7|nr:FUSC family protein [Geodermatophilus sp. TF02-6]
MQSSGAGRWPVLDRGSALARTAEAGWPIVQQTAAAAVAWVIAVAVVDQDTPFFAPIAAVVGLNATLGRRGSNAVRLLVGVVVGIVVGELAVAVAGGGLWTLTAATLVAMVVAQLVDGARIVMAQAAVAAILITAFGNPAEGVYRLLEALIGGGVALVFSQLVFAPEPLRLLRRAETAVLTVLADGLRLTADALEHDDPAPADQALTELRGLRDRLADLSTMRKASDRIVRHSATWRSRRAPVVRERESADQLDLLAGSCLMLTRTAMATRPEQRTSLGPVVRQLSEAVAALAEQPGDRPARQRAAEHALELARWVIQHGAAVEVQSPMAAACAAVRRVAIDVMVFAGVEPAQALGAVDAAVRVQVADPPQAPRMRWPWHRSRAGRAGSQRAVPGSSSGGSRPVEPAG